MIDCLILGDSIAVGVGQYRPDCATEALVGISSSAFVSRYVQSEEAAHVVISLGSNDRGGTLGALLELRSEIRAARVYWILPASREAAEAVELVARAHGDRVFGFRAGADRVHPADYRELAGRLP